MNKRRYIRRIQWRKKKRSTDVDVRKKNITAHKRKKMQIPRGKKRLALRGKKMITTERIK